MARPAKSVNVSSKHLTKAEKDNRSQSEDMLKGKTRKPPSSPGWLTDNQKKLFRLIVKELKEADILCRLDEWILRECVIAIDRLEQIERDINSEPGMIYAKETVSAIKNYTAILFRCCNELCLSPQSRAKIANINSQADDGTALLKQILSGNTDVEEE